MRGRGTKEDLELPVGSPSANTLAVQGLDDGPLKSTRGKRMSVHSQRNKFFEHGQFHAKYRADTPDRHVSVAFELRGSGWPVVFGFLNVSQSIVGTPKSSAPDSFG